MNIEIDGWTFTRQLGIGEREHVRTQLLGIGFFGHTDMLEQIKGAVAASRSLGMMLRAHVNFGRLADGEQVLSYMRDYAGDSQIEIWQDLDRAAFDSFCRKCEILITPGGKTQVATTVFTGILEVWAKSGGRFLQGNFASKTDAELRLVYPQFYHSTDKYWDLWNA